jgi:hypothetical protein
VSDDVEECRLELAEEEEMESNGNEDVQDRPFDEITVKSGWNDGNEKGLTLAFFESLLRSDMDSYSDSSADQAILLKDHTSDDIGPRFGENESDLSDYSDSSARN